MIRRFENKDLDQVMSIWLQVNMESHSFIEADYWKNNYEMVREMIPKAECKRSSKIHIFSPQSAHFYGSPLASN